MADKKDILNSWIMVELLSEGDIKPTDKKYIGFDDLKEEDYYSFFQNQLSQRANNVYKNAKNGIAVYLNIFDFQIIVDFLRNKYKLSAPEEEIKYGSKFSLVLYFDKDLNLLNDLTFFTVNGFILSQKRVPDLAEFREYEENQKTKLAQFFGVENSDSEDAKNNGQSLENAKSNEPPRVDPQVFNEAMKKAFSIFDDQIELSDCKVQVINNIESDAVNLHSFFIEDLEKAKTISTENLNKYLLGESLNRINLDSKNDSGSFNPEVLADILQPKNYPLGRFPSNTKYALFFMQQIAVNLSIGYDNNQIRSVNGPPGTGKTTLLKDIFAELIVKQAHDICRLSNKEICGTENTKYYNNASIGMIPENIAENSIIVASSNNGAVQNIVDELPLSKGVSESLLPELQAIDYFRDISNSSIESSWSDGVEKLELISKDPNFWGLFSLEGGRSDNMKNILSCMKAVVQSFDNGVYESDPDIYDHFEKQYKAAEEYREGIQKLSVDYRQYIKDKEKYAEARDAFTIDEKTWEEKIELGNVENAQKQSLWEKEKRDLSPKITEIDQLIAEKKENCDKYSELLANLKANKPRPWIFAKNEIKMQYNENLSKAQTGFTHALEEQQDLENQRSAYRKQFNEIDAKMKESAAEQEELKASFAVWKDRQLKGLAELDNKISLGSTVFNEKYNGIKLSSSYNELQLSNPWFDEQYRIIQSKLFIEALKVRKQFLYENRKNIKAATIIWNKQNEYLEKKQVIQAAWNWMNMVVPVISSTFASFGKMCKYLGANSLGHLFIDEAGQALPQASVGAIFRSRHVMVVGDPAQIKPVLTLEPNVLGMLGNHFKVSEKYLSESASTQTLVDAISQYGYYRDKEHSDSSWIGIPLWVHSRCRYPMFNIANKISYNDMMVHREPQMGKAEWYDVKGKAKDKYVEEQGEFLLNEIQKKIKENPKIIDKNEKDTIYVISPFANVAYQLAVKLKKIGFTRYDDNNKPTNVGTIHTFQGKEAPIVFMVLGADAQSKGAAAWAVTEPNMMNVAATRAKEEFYIIGDKELYLSLGCDVARDTYQEIQKHKHEFTLSDLQICSKGSPKAS